MEVEVLSFPEIEGEQCLRIYSYEKNLVLYCTIEVLLMSDESQVEKQNEIQIPFSCKVFLVAWRWQEASSVSWSDFEGDEGEVSPETEDKVSLSGSRNPSWDSVTWCDEKAPWLATGVRSATPESDSGEETLQPLGRSDLVMFGVRETEGCWAKRSLSSYGSESWCLKHLLRDKLAFAQEKEPLDVGLFLRTHSSWLLINKQCS